MGQSYFVACYNWTYEPAGIKCKSTKVETFQGKTRLITAPKAIYMTQLGSHFLCEACYLERDDKESYEKCPDGVKFQA